jgi:cobalt-precorrin 5A hydrolase/precorrin-3B C17-methyltransferase
VAVLSTHRSPDTPVVVGRDVGRPDEDVRVITLDTLADAGADMRTVIVIGSSTTRVLPDRPLGASVYTPRWYDDDRRPQSDQPEATPASQSTA